MYGHDVLAAEPEENIPVFDTTLCVPDVCTHWMVVPAGPPTADGEKLKPDAVTVFVAACAGAATATTSNTAMSIRRID